MSRRNVFKHALLFTTALIMLSSCSNEAPEDAQLDSLAVSAPIPYIPYDDRLLEVSKALPEFAGLTVDEDGTVEVQLVQSSPNAKVPSIDTIEAAIDEGFEDFLPDPGLGLLSVEPQQDIEITTAKYKFSDLYSWREKARSLFASNDLVSLDISDEINRIQVSAISQAASERLEGQMIALGIPSGAFTINITGGIVPEANLNSKVRPLVGGLNARCSIGFVGTRKGVKGFITNSHCTDTQGSVDSKKFYQPGYPSSKAGDLIGRETVDPAYTTGGKCAAGAKCRYSDSAFVATDSSITTLKGQIARLGIVLASTNYKVKQVTNYDDPKVVYVTGPSHKVGWATGETQYPADESRAPTTVICKDGTYTKNGQKFVFWCQNEDKYESASGDSGAPVFYQMTEGTNVGAVGVHWGSTLDSAGNKTGSIYSPIAAVLSELGMVSSDIIAP